MSAKNIDDQDFENQSNNGADASYDEPYEDDATYSEDDADQWSDDTDLADEEDADADQPPPKKKSSNLMIGVILFVIIIAVFGFMALKGGNNAASDAAPEAQTAINADAEMNDLKSQADQSAVGEQTANVPVPSNDPVSAAPQQGLMDNPDLASQNANSQEASNVAPMPMTAPEADTAPVQTSSNEANTTADVAPVAQPSDQSKDVVAAISPTVKPVSDFPTVDSIKKPDAPAEPSTSVAITPVSPVTSAAADAKSAELQAQVVAAQSRILTLQKQVEDQAAELASQKQKAASAVVPTGHSDEEVEALKSKISDLEAKLASKAASKPVKVISERDESADTVDRSSYQSTSSIKKAPVVAAKPNVVVKAQWSLKSAGTGKAILANKATGDLKSVRVGDTVPGLGRIVSIASSNSSWVVRGTTGTVTE